MSVPTSSRLLVMVLAGLEKNNERPTFERLQAAVVFANKQMPQVGMAGLLPVTHELREVINQTKELNLIFEFGGIFMLTEKGRQLTGRWN